MDRNFRIVGDRTSLDALRGYDSLTDQWYEEQWKPIIGYEELYEISDFGRIKNLPHSYGSGKNHNNIKFVSMSIRKTAIHPNGYEGIVLTNNGVRTTYTMHRLVWEHFGDGNRINLQIDHIDEIKANNWIRNLQLLTPKENKRKSIHRDLPTGVVIMYNKFQAQITKHGKGYYLGSFDTPEEAHQKYLWAEENL